MELVIWIILFSDCFHFHFKDEKKHEKLEPEDPAENSDGYSPDEKEKGTIDRNKGLKVCHYVSGSENKVAPVIYTTDSFLRRNKGWFVATKIQENTDFQQ